LAAGARLGPQGEVVQVEDVGVGGEGGEAAVERRDGSAVRGVGDPVANHAFAVDQDAAALRMERQPVGEAVAVLEVIGKGDDGDGADVVQILLRHRPPDQAGHRLLSVAVV
jgi:hypothetical protein